jgi:hypothetical protein
MRPLDARFRGHDGWRGASGADQRRFAFFTVLAFFAARGGLAALRFFHNSFVAMSAPSRIALNFSHTTVGWTSVW